MPLLQMGLGAFPGSRRVPLDVEEQESVRSGGSKDSARLAGKWSGSWMWMMDMVEMEKRPD